MNKADMIQAVKESDQATRELFRIKLARTTFSRLEALPYPTIKRINNWYGKLLNTKGAHYVGNRRHTVD